MYTEILINDGYTDSPRNRALDALICQKEAGKPVVGVYCCYAPVELVWAMGGVVADLCAYSNKSIPAAEVVLPSSICPLIKSSYGFITTDGCPFFAISDAVVAETTCDGKKKMFELIQELKPMITLELPQKPDDVEAQVHWESEVRKFRIFLENTFNRTITDENLESAIKAANKRRQLLLEIARYARYQPPYINWSEINGITNSFYPVGDGTADQVLERVIAKLEKRRTKRTPTAPKEAPRVLVTGCPIGGDTYKVLHTIEEAGGVVVAQEACSGIKPLLDPVEEDTKDPLAAIAARYLRLPCSCMTPNTRRLHLIDHLIEEFQPALVIDVVLCGCHSYNIESFTIKEHITNRHHLPFLKIETDYSEGDIAQIRTRIEALLELSS